MAKSKNINIRKLIHLEDKHEPDPIKKHSYYGSFVALFEAKKEGLGVSKTKIDHWDWEKFIHFENERVIIRKGLLQTTHSLARATKRKR